MDISDILMSWDVSQDTIKVFHDNNIDTSCLEGLGEEELKILIPESRLRDRIKFKLGYGNYKRELETVHSNTDSLDTVSLSSMELFSDEYENSYDNSKLNLQEILKDNMQGRQALAAITKKKLDSSSRSNLVQGIVEYYLKTYKKMTRNDFVSIAAEIVKLCPKECKETYYVPSRTFGPKKNMPAKGKLVDRYYNQLRILRGSGVIPKKQKLSISYPETSDNENTETDTDDEMQWLKYNRDPWPLVEEKWQASCAYRKKMTYNSDKTLMMMVNEWPCLKTTNGHRLIEIDFIHLYPDQNTKLLEKWDSFHNTAIKLIKADATVQKDLKEQIMKGNENTRDFALCSALVYKMKPTSKVLCNDNKKYYKVSIAESRQAFITQVKNYAEIEEALRNRQKSYMKKGLTCQPIIIGVGMPEAVEAFYVVIDDVKYRFDSLTKAIDVCFKCFMVLNLSYPKECEQVWIFIQQYFYEIQLPSDKKFCQVYNFIKELQE